MNSWRTYPVSGSSNLTSFIQFLSHTLSLSTQRLSTAVLQKCCRPWLIFQRGNVDGKICSVMAENMRSITQNHIFSFFLFYLSTDTICHLFHFFHSTEKQHTDNRPTDNYISTKIISSSVSGTPGKTAGEEILACSVLTGQPEIVIISLT